MSSSDPDTAAVLSWKLQVRQAVLGGDYAVAAAHTRTALEQSLPDR